MGTVTALRKPARPAHAGPVRPLPPGDVLTEDNNPPKELFAPAAGIGEWALHHLLEDSSPLFNPDHEHLRSAIEAEELCFLWAATSFARQGRTVLGTAEQVTFRAGGWQKARQEAQMFEWFGMVPPFLITLAADFCAECSDAEFAALLEHELYHVAHARDKVTGELKFDRETGRPKLAMRGHDVEEFVGVVRRYGVPREGALRDLIDVAGRKPEVAVAHLASACGTCLERAA